MRCLFVSPQNASISKKKSFKINVNILIGIFFWWAYSLLKMLHILKDLLVAMVVYRKFLQMFLSCEYFSSAFKT